MTKTTFRVTALTAILTVMVGFSSAIEAKFTDIPANHWAETAVDRMVEMGITGGYPDGTFRGKKTVTRYELALYLASFDRYVKTQFTDRVHQQDSKIQSLEVQVKQLQEQLSSANAHRTAPTK